MHISSLYDRFINDSHNMVKAGDIVNVKVMDVDMTRKRIALTMRLDERSGEDPARRDMGERRQDNGVTASRFPASSSNLSGNAADSIVR